MTKVAMLDQYIDRLIAVGDKSSHLGRSPIVKLVREKAIIRVKTVTGVQLLQMLQRGENQRLDP